MRLLCAGLPLKVRARLQGELEDVEVHAANSEEKLLEAVGQTSYQALILDQHILQRPPLTVLSEVTAHFHGLLIFIFDEHLHAAELRQMVHSFHVGSLLQHPAQAEDLLRSLARELGLRIRKSSPERGRHPEEPSLESVWSENQSAIEGWLQCLQALAASPQEEMAPEARAEGRRAANFLASNLGTFGMHRATLLAREALRLLQPQAGSALQKERLARVVEAIREVFSSSQTQQRRARRILIVVSDDESFCDELEVEAHLLQWDIQTCEELTELPDLMAQPCSRVVLLDPSAGACKRRPDLLAELLQDPYPTVALANRPAPPSTASTRWLELPVSAYSVMMAVLRTQLAPALDNPPSILVVDDDRIALEVLKRTLEAVDFHVEALNSPLEFWDCVERNRPDLVILDIDLPNLSGIEICRALRLDERYATLPVLFVSAYADSETVQRAFEAGADDFVSKPVSPLELRVRVSNRLERCRQRHLSQRGSLPPGRTYTTMDQLMLRSMREQIPLCLFLIESQACSGLAQAIRAQLRGEDVLKPLSSHELLLAGLAHDPRPLGLRLQNLLLQFGGKFALVCFPEDGHDPQVLLQRARQQLHFECEQDSREEVSGPPGKAPSHEN